MKTVHVGWLVVATAAWMTGCSEDAAVTTPVADTILRGPGSSIALDDPGATLTTFRDAFVDRDSRALQSILGGRFVFHTDPDAEIDPVLTRSATYAAWRALLTDADLVDVAFDLTWDVAVPADDPEHPDWMMIDAVASLRLTIDAGEDPFILILDAIETRFVFGVGPSVSNDLAGWQLMSMWDEGSFGVTEEVTWTDIIALYLTGPPQQGNGS